MKKKNAPETGKRQKSGQTAEKYSILFHPIYIIHFVHTTLAGSQPCSRGVFLPIKVSSSKSSVGSPGNMTSLSPFAALIGLFANDAVSLEIFKTLSDYHFEVPKNNFKRVKKSLTKACM